MPSGPQLKLLSPAEVHFPTESIEIDLIFCEHNSPKSLPQEFGRLTMQADVIALEAVGWSSDGAKLRQDVAEGDQQALERLSTQLPLSPQGGFWRALHKGIFGTNAKVHHPEAPQNHPVANAYLLAMHEEAKAVSVYSSLAVPPRFMLPALRKTFAAISARDKYVLQHFFPEEVPRLDGSIHYVGIFGLLHRGLAAAISQQAEEQGRHDVIVRSYEKGSVDPTPYERYLQGINPTAMDVEAYYRV